MEDVVTTGGSTVQAIERVREEGLEIVGVVSVLDRLAGGEAAIRAASGDAPYLPLTTIDDVYPDRARPLDRIRAGHSVQAGPRAGPLRSRAARLRTTKRPQSCSVPVQC